MRLALENMLYLDLVHHHVSMFIQLLLCFICKRIFTAVIKNCLSRERSVKLFVKATKSGHNVVQNYNVNQKGKYLGAD